MPTSIPAWRRPSGRPSTGRRVTEVTREARSSPRHGVVTSSLVPRPERLRSSQVCDRPGPMGRRSRGRCHCTRARCRRARARRSATGRRRGARSRRRRGRGPSGRTPCARSPAADIASHTRRRGAEKPRVMTTSRSDTTSTRVLPLLICSFSCPSSRRSSSSWSNRSPQTARKRSSHASSSRSGAARGRRSAAVARLDLHKPGVAQDAKVLSMPAAGRAASACRFARRASARTRAARRSSAGWVRREPRAWPRAPFKYIPALRSVQGISRLTQEISPQNGASASASARRSTASRTRHARLRRKTWVARSPATLFAHS